MKKWLKSIALLLTLIIMAANFVGCKQKTITLEIVSKLPKQTLTISDNLTGQELISFQSILEKLNAKSNDYKLEIQDISITNYANELDNLINTNNAPDIIMIENSLLSLMKRDTLLDITGQVTIDKNIMIENYHKSTIDAITYNNKIYGLPFACSPFVLFYNQDMFEASGVSLPTKDWTWDDFRNAAKKLTKDTNNDGKIDQWGSNFLNEIIYKQFLLQFLRSYNVDIFNIDSPQAIDAFNMLSCILDDKSITTGQQFINIKRETGKDPFASGRAAMDFEYAYSSYNEIVAKDIDNLRITEMPYGTVKGTIFTEKILSINAKTKHKEAAYIALTDLIQSLKNGDFIPPVKAGLAISALNKLKENNDMSVINNSINNGTIVDDLYDNIMSIIDNKLIGYNPIVYIDNKYIVENALKDAAKLIKELRSK